MKYILNRGYSFCGWDKLPYAITGESLHKPIFMNWKRFQLLWNCDGKTEISPELLDSNTARFFDRAISVGIVQKAEEGTRLQLHDYKSYPCRYRSDVQLSITGRCNYRCRHCFQSAPHGVLGQPTTEQVCKELDQIAECGIRDVSITGGEPLIHEGFWEIIDHMTELGLRLTVVYSNGKLVNQDLLDAFRKRNLHPSWQISFDGLGQHDHIRGVKGAEESAIRAIKLLVANNFYVACAYTLTKRTLPVFRDSVNFLASLGVHSLKSGCTQAQGEWLNNKEEWLTDADYLNFYKEYIPQYLMDGRPLNLQFEGLFTGNSDKMLAMEKEERAALQDAEDHAQENAAKDAPEAESERKEKEQVYRFYTKDREVTEEASSRFLACGVLGTSFYIGPTGRVLPCMGMDETPVSQQFPTLWEVPLKEILSQGSRLIEATSYTMKDVFDHNLECKDCEQKTHCGSGCRANAIGSDGTDYLALDRRVCLLCKEDWAGQVKKEITAQHCRMGNSCASIMNDQLLGD